MSWDERAGRLFEEFSRPAKAMIRRAYRSAFGDDELDDIYNGAWVGTLRALARRHAELSDDEIRSYVFTAVAHQAGKEIRRRNRRPTAPLEQAAAVADVAPSPEDRADQREDSRVTRDLLASLPRRRRAVLMLRYGWGLDPSQVCDLVKGLSPRAYRKEITRGVDELAQKLKLVETGEWCADREPVLKAYAAGLADQDQQLQAQRHLSHCRHCSEFVGKLTGHLHDLGSALALPGAVDLVVGDGFGPADRVGEALDRAKEPVASFLGRGGTRALEPASQVSSGGGLRGAGATGTAVVAKLAGLGTAGKITAGCIGGGVVATACIAAGVGPLHQPIGSEPAREQPPTTLHEPKLKAPAAAQQHGRRLADVHDPAPAPVSPANPAPVSPPELPLPAAVPPAPAGDQDKLAVQAKLAPDGSSGRPFVTGHQADQTSPPEVDGDDGGEEGGVEPPAG